MSTFDDRLRSSGLLKTSGGTGGTAGGVADGIAAYHVAFRPGLPPAVVEVLMRAASRYDDPMSLLDLGTGTGLVVRALHPFFGDIIAVDPVADLLDAAERDLCQRISPGTELRLVQSRAEEFTPPEGWTASLVTICCAFHWMDGSAVLDRLATIVPPTGVVAVLRDRGFWNVATPWKSVVRAVVHDFLGAEHRPSHETVHRDVTYAEALAGSAFGDVEEVTVPVRRTWNADSILGFLYSAYFAAPARFGERIGEFEREARRVLDDHTDDGAFREEEEFLVVLGRRPSPAG